MPSGARRAFYYTSRKTKLDWRVSLSCFPNASCSWLADGVSGLSSGIPLKRAPFERYLHVLCSYFKQRPNAAGVVSPAVTLLTQRNIAETLRISFRGIMKEKRRCANCGTTRFGLIRHRWYRHQFCRKKCRDQFLDKLAKDKDQFLKWLTPKPT